jgi:hypoxanthine phosphoribosyltransferase
MRNDIEKVLFTEKQISDRVTEMGKQISKDYEGKELLLIGILKGSVPFMADLLKKIDIYCNMDFMAVSSYGDSTETSGVVRILKDLDHEIKGKEVLIIEDIIDSGYTLKYLVNYLKSRNPNSVEIACLLDKPDRREVNTEVKYLGFRVPNYFLVGYGLDYAERYRNLPYVGVLKEEIYVNK